MKDNKKSILISVISGLIVCIVCAGVIFLFPSDNNTLKGNEYINNNKSEVKLGDTVCYGNWHAVTDYGEYKSGTCTTTAEPISSTSGISYTQCSDNHSPGDSECPTDYIAYGCHKERSWSRQEQPCPADAPVISCNTVTYTGELQEVATCTGGTITLGGSGRSAGEYNVRCEGAGGVTEHTCVMAKAAGYVEAHGVTVVVGQSSSIGATTSGTATYTLVDGADKVTLSGDTVTGVAVGSATIRISSATNNNYTAASKNISVQVIEPTPCYKLVANKCTSENVTSTTCDNASGYYATEDECNANVTCPAGQFIDFTSPTNCSTCPKGHKCTGDGTKVACSASNEYQDETGQSVCKTCISHGVTTDHTKACTQCESTHTYSSFTDECIPISGCGDGYWRGQYGCQACEAGYYCPNGTSRIACPAGKTSEARAKSESDCYTKDSNLECSISVTKASETVSIDETDPTKNSFYTVKVSVNGRGCSGQKLTYSAVNGRLSVNGVSNVTSGFNYTFAVYPTTACDTSSATATLSNGKSGTVSFGKLSVKYDWKSQDGCWAASDVEGKYPVGSKAADAQGKDIYFSDYGQCNGDWGYTKMWTRANCGTPPKGPTTYSYCCVKNDGSAQNWFTNQKSRTCPEGYTIDNTKNASTCTKIFACYLDGDNTPHWTSSPQASWIKVNKPESECKDQEACFEDQTGARFWGKYYNQIANGYRLITSIKDEESCLDDDGACYINDSDLSDYRWSKTPITGYTKADSITSAYDCQPEACYIDKEKNDLAFGKYKDNDNYIPIYKTILVDNEYKDVLITDKSECTTEVPVPPTALGVSTLIYVFMGILMVCGVVFIYYSAAAKKQNQE